MGLWYHKSLHEDITRYQCEMCKYSTIHKNTLSRHVRLVHFPKKIDCKICDYKAPSKNCLNKHINNVHQTNNTNCPECNKILKKGNLSRHMKMLQSEQKSLYYCKMCPFQTIYKERVRTHTENVHQKLRKHKI